MIFFLIILLIFSVPACGADIIQAGISETHEVDPRLLPGQTFDDSAIPKQVINGWYRIPKWFAGTTRRDKDTYNGVERKSMRFRTRGCQVDAEGHVWEARREPIRYDIDGGFVIRHVVLTKEEPKEAYRNRMVMEYDGYIVSELKANKRIAEYNGVKSVHFFEPGPDDSIFANVWPNLTFDAKGRQLPGSPSRGSYVEHKIKPFEPIDRDDRFDYKADFAAYLHSINRDDLIP